MRRQWGWSCWDIDVLVVREIVRRRCGLTWRWSRGDVVPRVDESSWLVSDSGTDIGEGFVCLRAL